MENNIGEARRSYAMTRNDGKFSQEDAAAYFDVSLSTYQKWEQGTGKSLKIEVLCSIADLYGTSVDYLLCRTNSPSFEPIRYPGRYERELLSLVSDMGEAEKETLIKTARAFSALSEKEGQNAEGIVSVGAVDVVM